MDITWPYTRLPCVTPYRVQGFPLWDQVQCLLTYYILLVRKSGARCKACRYITYLDKKVSDKIKDFPAYSVQHNASWWSKWLPCLKPTQVQGFLANYKASVHETWPSTGRLDQKKASVAKTQPGTPWHGLAWASEGLLLQLISGYILGLLPVW